MKIEINSINHKELVKIITKIEKLDRVAFFNIDPVKTYVTSYNENKTFIKYVECNSKLLLNQELSIDHPIKIGLNYTKKLKDAISQFSTKEIMMTVNIEDEPRVFNGKQYYWATSIVLQNQILKITIPCAEVSMQSLELAPDKMKMLFDTTDGVGLSMQKESMLEMKNLCDYSEGDIVVIAGNGQQIMISENEYNKMIAETDATFKSQFSKAVFKYVDVDAYNMYIFPDKYKMIFVATDDENSDLKINSCMSMMYNK